jgi:hypothetical protein
MTRKITMTRQMMHTRMAAQAAGQVTKKGDRCNEKILRQSHHEDEDDKKVNEDEEDKVEDGDDDDRCVRSALRGTVFIAHIPLRCKSPLLLAIPPIVIVAPARAASRTLEVRPTTEPRFQHP